MKIGTTSVYDLKLGSNQIREVRLGTNLVWQQWSPSTLFASGEQGAWYDPSDFNRYMVTGSELISNWNFASDGTDWVDASSAPAIVDYSGTGALLVSNGNTSRLRKSMTTVVGKRYVVTAVHGVVNAVARISSGYTAGGTELLASTAISTGEFTYSFVAVTTETWFNWFNSGTPSVEVISLSVKELTQIESCTMFQDSTAVTPVTAVEQPVGLMLDKKTGPTFGTELYTGGNITGVPIGGATFNNYSLGITAETGKTYRFNIDVTDYAGTNTYSIGGIFGTDWVVGAVAKTGNGRWSFTLIALRSVAVAIFTRSTNTANFSNISVKELPGNHAYQTTAIDRPILRNRYNLLIKSEQFNDAAWTKTGVTVTANSAMSPTGQMTADLITGTGVASGTFASQSLTTAIKVGDSYTCSLWVRNASANLALRIARSGGGTYEDNVVSIPQSSEWQLITVSKTFANAQTGVDIRLWSNATQNVSIEVFGASMVPSNQASIPYQRIDTATVYDSDTTKFPLYLACNGTNTGMQTSSINFTATDRVTVCAGIRKLSDVATGLVAEIGTDSFSVNGSFGVFAPAGNGSFSYRIQARGTVTYAVGGTAFAPSPDTAVITAYAGISSDTASLRRNAVTVASGTGDLGTGNYGNHQLYILRRAGSTMPFNGNFYGLIIRGEVNTAEQTSFMEKWMAIKTGVSL